MAAPPPLTLQQTRKRRWQGDAQETRADAYTSDIEPPSSKRSAQHQPSPSSAWSAPVAPSLSVGVQQPTTPAASGPAPAAWHQHQQQQQQQQQPFAALQTSESSPDTDVIELDVNPRACSSRPMPPVAEEPCQAIVPIGEVSSLSDAEDGDHGHQKAHALLAALRRTGLLPQDAAAASPAALLAVLRAPGAEARLRRLTGALTPQQRAALASAWREVSSAALKGAFGQDQSNAGTLPQIQAALTQQPLQIQWRQEQEEPSCVITELSSSSSGDGLESDDALSPFAAGARAPQGWGAADAGGDVTAVDSPMVDAVRQQWAAQQQQQKQKQFQQHMFGGFDAGAGGQDDMMVD